jgi:quaternary ammonium compound-resistance protein SugE
MAWTYLILAGLIEIGWPLGLKVSQQPGRFWHGIALALAGGAVSGLLLWLAQREIAIGTAYAVWTGIGAVGTFAVGILAFGDSASPARIASAAFIVAGITGLRLTHGALE